MTIEEKKQALYFAKDIKDQALYARKQVDEMSDEEIESNFYTLKVDIITISSLRYSKEARKRSLKQSYTTAFYFTIGLILCTLIALLLS